MGLHKTMSIPTIFNTHMEFVSNKYLTIEGYTRPLKRKKKNRRRVKKWRKKYLKLLPDPSLYSFDGFRYHGHPVTIRKAVARIHRLQQEENKKWELVSWNENEAFSGPEIPEIKDTKSLFERPKKAQEERPIIPRNPALGAILKPIVTRPEWMYRGKGSSES